MILSRLSEKRLEFAGEIHEDLDKLQAVSEIPPDNQRSGEAWVQRLAGVAEASAHLCQKKGFAR
jgi:hypothetical protein